MKNASRPGFLRRLITRRAAPSDERDAADMGTAFGLDFSLDQRELSSGTAVEPASSLFPSHTSPGPTLRAKRGN